MWHRFNCVEYCTSVDALEALYVSSSSSLFCALVIPTLMDFQMDMNDMFYPIASEQAHMLSSNQPLV
jgi:hypothetical protein